MILELSESNAKSIKKQIYITGTLLAPLRAGAPAVFLYRGKRYQTAAVLEILEMAPAHVVFETRHLIYTIRFGSPAESHGLAA